MPQWPGECDLTRWGGPTPFLPMEKWGTKYMEREGNEYFPPWGKMGKKVYREGNEYFSLSFHILFFSFFPMGKNGKTHIFPWANMGLDPPHKVDNYESILPTMKLMKNRVSEMLHYHKICLLFEGFKD